jgi:RimJ/RimL family protein N-acetyltransferase
MGQQVCAVAGIGQRRAAIDRCCGGIVGRGSEPDHRRSLHETNSAPRDGSVLELAKGCDVPTRWSCRTATSELSAARSALIRQDVRMREAVTVRGGSIVLRAFTPADAPLVDVVAADPSTQQWNPIGGSGLQWCAARADWSEGNHASWAVADPADPATLLGSVSLHKIDLDQRDCEIGFWVLPVHRGRGFAAAAVRAATAFAFADLDLRRVYMFHAAENEGSCRTAQVAGFRLEGVHRESYRYGDGIWHDEHSHARLRSDG